MRRLRHTRVYAYALTLAVSALAACSMGAAPASAVTVNQRLDLGADRSVIGSDTSTWDELQQVVRPKRDHALATFANRKEIAGAGTDSCGMSVDSADFNGDGLGDLVMGCPNAGAAGRVSVSLRNASDTAYLAPIALSLPRSGRCGLGLDVGDADGDGDMDIAVGCPTTYPSFVFCCYDKTRGSVIVVHGDGAGTFAPGVEIHTAPDYDACGYSVVFAKLDANLSDDLVVGCIGATNYALQGHVRVFRHDTGSTYFAPIDVASPTPAGSEQCGAGMDAGRVNGDAFDDIVFGCLGDSSTNGSAVVAINNGSGTAFATEATELRHPSPGTAATCGGDTSIAVDDLDGNGYDDVVMGCRGRDLAADQNQGGAVLFYRANTGASYLTGVGQPVVLTHPSPAAADSCGLGVSTGDINGDGLIDIAMGCPSDDPQGAVDSGGIVTFLRSGDNLAFLAGQVGTKYTPVGDDACGWDTSIVDVNQDGRSDIVMGCGTISIPGSVAVFDGSRTPTTTSDPTPEAGALCGHSLTTGDFNLDGLGDLVFGCPERDAGVSDSGSVDVMLRTGTPEGYGGVVRLGRAVPRVGDHCGESVATGDVNADGLDDVAYSCYWNSEQPAMADAGEVFVHLRASDGNSFGPPLALSRTFTDIAANDYCGSQIVFADVDGDERDEVIWSCYGATAGMSGRTWVSTWNPATGLFPRSSTQLARPAPNANVANDACGTSGLAAGDIDADGRADIAMGCVRGATGTAADAQGSVVVFRRTDDNTAFEFVTEAYDPLPANGNQCASWLESTGTGTAASLAMGDANADGFADLLLGCRGAGGNAGKGVVAIGDGAGAFTATTLAPTAPVVGEYCGVTVAFGDVNGDGTHDASLGCSSLREVATVAGRAVVFTRSSGNNGWDGDVSVRYPTSGNLDNCGASLALADLDRDGRSDIAMGCNRATFGPTANAGSLALISSTARGEASIYGLTGLETRRLNGPLPGPIHRLTFAGSSGFNGATGVAAEASADGGLHWESVPIGSPHTFAFPGNDLRIRGFQTAAPNRHMVMVTHDLTVSFDYDTPPGAPTLVSPVDAATTPSATPTLTATFLDADAGDTGTIHFEVCTAEAAPAQSCAAAGGTVAATGTSAASIAIGANGTWAVTPALVIDETYHWRSRSVDQHGISGAWSAANELVTIATMSVNVGVATAGMSQIEAASDGTASSTLTVASNDPGGYDVLARDGSNTTSMVCLTPAACGAAEIPDWTGTPAAPTPWAPEIAGPSGYAGVAVTAATSGLDPRWVPVGPDFDQPFAGLDTTARVLHRSTTTATNDTVELTWRFTPSMATLPGSYRSTVVVTVVGSP